MHTSPNGSSFIALDKALQAASIALALSQSIPSRMRPLADQLIRCSSSVPANLSEGHGRSGKSRRHHWQIAYGSAKESEVFLRLLISAGAVDTRRAHQAIGLLDEVRAMIWSLLHPR